MITVIRKYGPLTEATNVLDDIPNGGRIISTGVQGGRVFVWAVVEPDIKPTPRTLYVVATGTQVPELAGRLVGLAFSHDGMQTVFHVFEDLSTQEHVPENPALAPTNYVRTNEDMRRA